MNSGQLMRRLKKQRTAWLRSYRPGSRYIMKGIKTNFQTSSEINVAPMWGPVFSSFPVSSALGEAALRALGSEQPRAVAPEEVYRMMSPSSESTGWGKELAEDRESIVAEDPWEGR